ALTGVDTDRLKEEKERGISIELGFAPLRLPKGVLAGIVDVPGHERFVKTMLAGAGGIDLVLFVVAADEGVMPQTREHLDILELLRVQKGIVVITKVDLVDEEWLSLVKEDVQELLRGTFLDGAPIVPVSVVTGEGLEELRREIERVALEVQPKPIKGDARLPIDRVFSITGFGTVMTGTLISGSIRVGDVLELLPKGTQGRVRSLQVHGKKVDEAVAGQRVAVNLTGVEVGDVRRGDVLSTPGAYQAVRRITAYLHLLKNAPRPLKNWSPVHFHLGTSEAVARVRLLDRDELLPGDDAFAQFELEQPIVAAVHDRFVIRHYSPVTTIGGGEVVEAGGIRYRRYRQEVLAALKRKLEGTPEARVVEELRTLRRPVTVQELASRSGIAEQDLLGLLEEKRSSGEILLFELGNDAYVVSAQLLEEWWSQASSALRSYHRQHPLRPGCPKEELRTRLFAQIPQRLYQGLLERWSEEGRIALSGQSVALSEFSVKLTPDQEEKVRRLLKELESRPYAPPALDEILEILGGESDLLQHCVQSGVLVKIGEEFYFSRDAVFKGWEIIEKHLREHGEITVAEARDLLGTSRRYCLPLLEYFDRMKKTRRVGDKRVLYKA
ncbi:MAG: selenocysteine-specific translation elongation factor, partial [Thermacetogeniaceae bacterium]